MGKFSRDLDEKLVSIVDEIADERGLVHLMNIEPLRYSKPNFKDAGCILKGSAFQEAMTGQADVIGVVLNEELLLSLEDKDQRVIIETLMAQISYDYDKDKILITKPEISVPLGIYEKYKEIAIQKQILVQATLSQLKDIEKERKAAEKELKKASKAK